MTIQVLKLYLELSHLSMYKQWTYTIKQWLFFEKTMKGYFKAAMLSLKIYENILKFNFLIGGGGGIRHIGCLCKYFEAVIHRRKKQWSVWWFMSTLKYLWIDTNKGEFTQCKTMKTWRYSRHTSSTPHQTRWHNKRISVKRLLNSTGLFMDWKWQTEFSQKILPCNKFRILI